MRTSFQTHRSLAIHFVFFFATVTTNNFARKQHGYYTKGNDPICTTQQSTLTSLKILVHITGEFVNAVVNCKIQSLTASLALARYCASVTTRAFLFPKVACTVADYLPLEILCNENTLL